MIVLLAGKSNLRIEAVDVVCSRLPSDEERLLSDERTDIGLAMIVKRKIMPVGGGFFVELDFPIRRYSALGGLDTSNFMA